MPSFLSVFTLTSILTQTSISLLISWLTLDCKLQPEYPELQEVTIVKLLYLHDPQACGRVYFYNYTILLKDTLAVTTVQWPVKNEIAAKFRQKIQLWVSLHILWLVFCVAYMTQGHRSYGFYATLLPFTLNGLIILIMDIMYTAVFITDTSRTGTEKDVLNYINADSNSLYKINKTHHNKPFSKMITEPKFIQDTSWISLLFAYASCRGVVLWVFNFWMIKDNYFEGLAIFRRCQLANERLREKELKENNSQLSDISQV